MRRGNEGRQHQVGYNYLNAAQGVENVMKSCGLDRTNTLRQQKDQLVERGLIKEPPTLLDPPYLQERGMRALVLIGRRLQTQLSVHCLGIVGEEDGAREVAVKQDLEGTAELEWVLGVNVRC